MKSGVSKNITQIMGTGEGNTFFTEEYAQGTFRNLKGYIRKTNAGRICLNKDLTSSVNMFSNLPILFQAKPFEEGWFQLEKGSDGKSTFPLPEGELLLQDSNQVYLPLELMQ